jgi:glucose-1-phosphatase
MIKNIIFDLGVVLLNIDFQKTINAFRNLGISNSNELFSGYAQTDFFDFFEKGYISPPQFREEIRKYLNETVSDEMIDEAWNAMILDFPAEKINLLISIRNKYRTFLLSNTNAIHFTVYNRQLQDNFKIKNLSDLFEKAYYSYKLGLRKPDKEIFELVLNENSLLSEETIFIDDSSQHIYAADSLGIHTILFQPQMSLSVVLDELTKITGFR